MTDWDERAAHAIERYEDGLTRLLEERDARQRQLTRTANAAWAAGVSFLMLGRRDEAHEWLLRAAERYRESWPYAPPGSWGRPIGAMKSRLVAGDLEGAQDDARWALEAGAAGSESAIGRYAAALAELTLGEDTSASELAGPLREVESFPPGVIDALVALAARDGVAYDAAIRELLTDFEAREAFLEDTPVADTVIALQALAEPRGLVVELHSFVLPA